MLSQDELAELLDISQGRISRYENGEEYPTLAVVLALQVVFGRSPRSLVEALYESVEEAVMGRAAALELRLVGKKDFASVKKRHLLSAMMQRATKAKKA
jgi:transcriptional regulator with XRE-family HTH domain